LVCIRVFSSTFLHPSEPDLQCFGLGQNGDSGCPYASEFSVAHFVILPKPALQCFDPGQNGDTGCLRQSPPMSFLHWQQSVTILLLHKLEASKEITLANHVEISVQDPTSFWTTMEVDKMYHTLNV
jgi:hypothetical protein